MGVEERSDFVKALIADKRVCTYCDADVTTRQYSTELLHKVVVRVFANTHAVGINWLAIPLKNIIISDFNVDTLLV